MKAILTRNLSTDEGTFGSLSIEGGFTCVTGELPWRNNATGISCIPAGTYYCEMQWSPKHNKNVYHVLNVPGRTAVEIHSANLMGDVTKDYVAELEGCISPGETFEIFKAGTSPAGSKDQRGITNSAFTQNMLENFLNRKPFDLEITWSVEVK